MLKGREQTWVVGDIHGMYDPLKRLITEFRRREAMGHEKIRKIIFIGDYIDYGPSSKEVLDLLMNLEFETVFLAGNHEDMLLHFCKNSYFLEEFGNMWFNGNGGQDTLMSFNPTPEVFRKVERHPVETYHENYSKEFLPGDYQFEQKYMDFFSRLVYAHTETFNCDEKTFKLAFSHAGLDESRDLEEQLKLKTFDDFHNYIQQNKIYQENFNLWSRKEPKKKFGDYILIHGHTPTEMLADCYKNIGKYKPQSGLPYFKFLKPEFRTGYESYSYLHYFDGDFKDLISIDIDTGAAFGNYLTAIAFCPDIFWEKRIKVLQVATSGVHRGRKTDVKEYDIKVNPFAK